MSRRSFFKRRSIPVSSARWNIPTQLRHDLAITSRYLEVNEGEIVTVALLSFLEKIVPQFNERSSHLQIPSLASLDTSSKPMSTRYWIDHVIERISQ